MRVYCAQGIIITIGVGVVLSDCPEVWDVDTWSASHSSNDCVPKLQQFCGNVGYCFRILVRVSFCSFGVNGAIGKCAKSSLDVVSVLISCVVMIGTSTVTLLLFSLTFLKHILTF